MYCRIFLIALLTSVSAWCASPAACGPASEIQASLQKAAAAAKEPADFDHKIAPFVALRQRYPNDLFVHTAANPNFAPAHRTLAEIYGSETFPDARKLKVEQQKLLALCPSSSLVKRPSALPALSPLLERAEHLLTMNSVDLNAIVDMALQGVRDDEWRLQRIRPFDWYSVDFKRQSQRELQSRYWRLWTLQVRCYRKAGQTQKATDVLASMDQRVNSFRKSNDAFYWGLLSTLATLYAEGKQKEQATQKLQQMEQLLVEHPDAGRATMLEDLRKQVWSSL